MAIAWPMPRDAPVTTALLPNNLNMVAPRVLFIQSKPEHDFLIEKLKGVGAESKFRVDVVTSAQVPKEKADLGVFLSNYDCIILANVPSEELTEDQQEIAKVARELLAVRSPLAHVRHASETDSMLDLNIQDTSIQLDTAADKVEETARAVFSEYLGRGRDRELGMFHRGCPRGGPTVRGR